MDIISHTLFIVPLLTIDWHVNTVVEFDLGLETLVEKNCQVVRLVDLEVEL